MALLLQGYLKEIVNVLENKWVCLDFDQSKITIVWFQKISIPPPRRELDIAKGRGVKDQGNSRGEGGCMIDLLSRGFRFNTDFKNPFLPSKQNFHMKNSGLSTCKN